VVRLPTPQTVRLSVARKCPPAGHHYYSTAQSQQRVSQVQLRTTVCPTVLGPGASAQSMQPWVLRLSVRY
jgi:hypothetical protein